MADAAFGIPSSAVPVRSFSFDGLRFRVSSLFPISCFVLLEGGRRLIAANHLFVSDPQHGLHGLHGGWAMKQGHGGLFAAPRPLPRLIWRTFSKANMEFATFKLLAKVANGSEPASADEGE